MKLLALLGLPALLVSINLTSASPEPAQPAAAATYAIDGGHSSVLFRVKHAGASWFYGRFNEVSGSVSVDEDNLAGSSVNVEIKSASVDSNSEQRDAHITSPDFLSAKEFPVIKFESTEIAGSGDSFSVTGNLTFRGVTKAVTAKVEHVGNGEFRGARAGYEAVLDIKRSDFGSNYGIEENVLGDDVRLILALEGVKE